MADREEERVTHWRSKIEKDFLGSWDLCDAAGKPRDVTVEIESVKGEVLKTKEQPKGKGKLVLRFKSARKAFVCNATNGETIETMYGPEIEGWIAKKITLYPTMVRSPKGGQIMGIRVRPKKPTGPAEQVQEREPDPDVRAEQNAAFDRREPGSDDQ